MIFFRSFEKTVVDVTKSLHTMSFVWVLLTCVFFAGPISAADQEVTWTYTNPDIDLYDDEALTIRWSYLWSSYHDVWSHSPSDDPDCEKASVEEKASAMNSSWRAEAGTLASPGTYYFSCQVGGHCNAGMKVKVTRKTGSRDAATSPPPSSSSSPPPPPSSPYSSSSSSSSSSPASGVNANNAKLASACMAAAALAFL